MTRPFLAAALVALLIVAAVVVTVAVTPGAFGFGDSPQQSAPATNSRVIAVNVDVERKSVAPRRVTPVAPAAVPSAPAPVLPAPRAVAQTPPLAPTAVSGRRQQPAAPVRPPVATSAGLQKSSKLDDTD